MPLMPGEEPFFHPGGSTAVLLCHGFTGNPQSLRPLAEALAVAGYTVDLPLLPGHGTSVEDMISTRWENWSAAAEVAYQDSPRQTERCGRCSMYRTPHKCTLVRGEISPMGWCKRFERKVERR